MEHEKINLELKQKFTKQLIERANMLFPEGLVMSSSFGRYSAVMLQIASSQLPRIPVINIRLGEETECTKKHREDLTNRFDLNLQVFDIRCDKVKTLKYALQFLKARALISGVMWDETENREGFDYFMDDRTFGVQRVYPLLHWKHRDIMQYIGIHNLPINNDYEDSFKDCSEKKECGIHLFQNGAGI